MSKLNRRQALGGVAALGATTLLTGAQPAKLKGNIKHSIVFWCFNVAGEKWDLEKTCQIAKELGCVSIELTDPEQWVTMKKHGLTCAIAPNGMEGAPFMYGLNNPRYAPEVITRTKKRIAECQAAGVPSVIAFNGYKWVNADDPKSGEITREEGFANCVKNLKELASIAEKAKVTVCLEHLNTRDDTHPMKGHPGYQGDDLDYVAEIIKKVGSPNVKILFDIYHVQVMHGDLIRRLGQLKDYIGHIHTAGNPGRGELDANQEIAFPAVMQTLVELKYTGYVGHEFIPTRDPKAGLTEAVRLCDV